MSALTSTNSEPAVVLRHRRRPDQYSVAECAKPVRDRGRLRPRSVGLAVGLGDEAVQALSQVTHHERALGRKIGQKRGEKVDQVSISAASGPAARGTDAPLCAADRSCAQATSLVKASGLGLDVLMVETVAYHKARRLAVHVAAVIHRLPRCRRR